MQAHAQSAARYGARHSTGPSPWLVLGIVVLAASLVAVGTAVVLNSLDLGRAGDPPPPGPTPKTARATPGAFTVGRQEPTPEGDGAGPGLATPRDSAPVFAPSGGEPSGSGTPASAGAPSGDPSAAGSASPPDASPGPGASPAAGASPATAGQSADPRVERAFARLATVEEKVGQLLLLGWIGSTAEDARLALSELRAGGIVHVQNASAGADARTINQGLLRIAAESRLTPPLIAIDHEGGSVQRIKDVPNLGDNWEFGLQRPTDLRACQRGQDHARTLSALGFTMNLAPVLDVNNNPANPVIGPRSYSADPQTVARLGAAYVRGLQVGGVAAVGKHFPGHGNTSVDSHLQLPSLPQTAEQLAQVELVPFRRAIEAGIAGIMSAHIVFPAVDPSGVPATLSRPIMTGLLRETLGFRGLVVTDDLGAMKAITDNYGAGDAAVRAVQAGVDFLIMSAELPRQRQARDALLAAVRSGEISRERLDDAVRRVLEVKAQYGVLDGTQPPGVPCQ